MATRLIEACRLDGAGLLAYMASEAALQDVGNQCTQLVAVAGSLPAGDPPAAVTRGASIEPLTRQSGPRIGGQRTRPRPIIGLRQGLELLIALSIIWGTTAAFPLRTMGIKPQALHLDYSEQESWNVMEPAGRGP